MLKRSLLLSSLLLSVPAWAGTQASGAAPDAAGQVQAVVQAGDKAKPAASGTASGGQPSSTSRAGQPDPLRVALLAQRHSVRRSIFQLRAARDSELSRLSLARLAVTRGGEVAGNKTDQEMLADMKRLEADYDSRLSAERARLSAIDARLAKLDARQD